MSDNQYTARDLAYKVDSEGGVASAIIGYGIKPDELPDDAPDDVKVSWRRVHSVSEDVHTISRWLGQHLSEGEYDDE